MHQEPKEGEEGIKTIDGQKVLMKAGTEYREGEYIFLHPEAFDSLNDVSAERENVPEYAAKGRFHKVSPLALADLPSVNPKPH